ncbi:hypothetical protein L3Q82_003654 [Scortum barcoo]|uniref:Uncharacterized protein n=1 Tax=Scortum barcoo TaxID=214431 RepID=A0ACB8VN43_9TELE|nr:hypothetical protein L3Q82_003654 [Scortum barcoo]
MDLISGFYNVPLHEDHKKYTAFSSPFGPHEYNRMPQGLSNSPATFMRMKMVFSHLKNHNLKLAPRKMPLPANNCKVSRARHLPVFRAVLSQLQPGEKVARPVAFARAICDKFSHWLKGRHFTAWSDNNSLTYILTKPRLDACEQRWVAKLAAYDFDLKYVPGCKNNVADALSHEPFVKSSIGHRLLKEPHLSLNQSSKQVARCSWDKFFCIYGFPKRIHSDQGANFVCKWPQMLQMLTFCYNCTAHETTGFAPFYLMFGRIPRLPIDIMFHHVLENDSIVSHHEFVNHLRSDLSKGLTDCSAACLWIRDAVTGREKVVHRNMLLLPVDFLSFPEPTGSQGVSGESQSAVPCGSDHCSVVDNQEQAQSRTMNRLMQSPAQVEEESESVSDSSDLSNTSLVLAMDTGQSEELPNCAADDSEHLISPTTHAHNSSSDYCFK